MNWDNINDFLNQDLLTIGKFSITLYAIIQVILVLVFMRLTVSLLNRSLKRYFRKRKIDQGRAFAFSRMIKYTIYFIAGIIILSVLNINYDAIVYGSAGLLVGIGFGLQQIFSDFLSGIILLLEGEIEVGDQVKIENEIGTIRSIGTRSSKVETPDHNEHIIPNSMIIGNRIVNLSLDVQHTRFSVDVGVSYNSNPSVIKELLLNCANEHPDVLGTPPPSVQFREFADSSINFKLLFCTKQLMQIEKVKSDLRFSIFDSFRKNKIEIPYPQRDIWIKKGTES